MISRYNCQLNSEKKRNDEKNQMTITGRQKKVTTTMAIRGKSEQIEDNSKSMKGTDQREMNKEKRI